MPDEDSVRTDVLHDEDDAPYVIEQSVVGPDNEKGGGEWPDPDTPAEAPAPGSVASEDAAIKARRQADRAESDNTTPSKAVLDADPVAGGSKSTPD